VTLIRVFFVRIFANKLKLAWSLIGHVKILHYFCYSGLTPVSMLCVNTVTPVSGLL